MSRSPATSSVYDIKSADLPLVAFQLKSTDMQAVANALAAQLQETPDFFNQDPALIDLDGLSADEGDIDFSVLLKVLQTHGLKPVAIKSGQRDWLDAALRAGLVAADDARVLQACAAHGVQALLTCQDHASGSDRLAEACALLGLPPF